MDVEIKIPWSMPDIGDEEKAAVQRVMDSGWLTCGEETKAFERELSAVTGCKYNVCVNNGTSALIAALLALNTSLDEVKHLPAYTYQATLNAVYAACGIGNIEYHDIDAMSGLMEPLKSGVQIPVCYAGAPLDPEKWCDVNNVVVDAAEALGSDTCSDHLLHDNPDINWVICYSFHAAKIITTVEGGCCSTDNPLIYHRLKAVRNHGEDPDHRGVYLSRGLNLKPTDIGSAIGRVQLRKIGGYLERRRQVAIIYREYLGGLVGFQRVGEYVKRHGNMMFPIFVENPPKLASKLKEAGIDTRLGWEPLSPKPNAQFMHEHVICLPMFNTMSDEAAEYVATKVMEALA